MNRILFEDFRKDADRVVLQTEALDRVEKAVLGKQQAQKFFVLEAIMWAVVSVFLRLALVVVSRAKKKLVESRFLKFCLKRYFSLRGVTFYRAISFPKSVGEKPFLILTTRYHSLSSLFAYTLFDFPVIVPRSGAAAQFRFHHRLPFTFFQKPIQSISYPDGALSDWVPEVKKMLKKGYSVMVHINDDYWRPEMGDPMHLYPDVLTLLKEACVPLFLHMDGMEKYPFASFFTPIQVRCDLEPLEFVWMSLDSETDHAKLDQIALYFNGKGHRPV